MHIKKIVIIGPESTGKSTLSKALAEHFGEPCVPEFARQYIEELDRPYTYEDLLAIAKGQMGLEDKLAEEAKAFLICDTDLHVMEVWSQHSFGKTHAWTSSQIQQRKYDLYLLTDIDIPWEADPQREHPDPKMRQFFFDRYLQIVKNSGVHFEIISGNLQERIQSALRAIQNSFPNAS